MTQVHVEQRSEVRQAPAPGTAAARLQLLGEGAAAAGPMPAQIANLSGRGARVLLPVAATPGSLVKLDWNDTMLLGEVCYCEAAPDGGFAIGLRLEHSLVHTESLRRMQERFAY